MSCPFSRTACFSKPAPPSHLSWSSHLSGRSTRHTIPMKCLIDMSATIGYEETMLVDESVREKIRTLLEETPQQDPYKRFTILTYQLGDVGKCLRYMEIYPDEHQAQRAYFKTAISDLLIQVMILAELYNLDLKEITQLGADRLDEFRKRGKYVEV